MASPTVMLWCTLHPAPGKEAKASFVREVLLGLAAKVGEVEKTCLRYEVFEKNDTQGTGIVFHLLEKWPSEADLERHTRRDWLIAIRKQFDSGLLAQDEFIEKVSNIGSFQT